MLLNSKIQDDVPEYKRCHNNRLEHLAYEEAINILETLDESLRTQAEYEYSQLFEDLALDSEDVRMVQAHRNLS
jgi:hypothetical protein